MSYVDFLFVTTFGVLAIRYPEPALIDMFC